MKIFRTTLLLAFTAIGVNQSIAQTADEIAGRWTTAMGGKEKLSSIQSIYTENELTISNNLVPSKNFVLNGKGFKSESDFGGQKIIDCYTVNDGWMINPLAGQSTAVKMPETQIKAGQFRLDAQGPLFNYAAKGSKLELAGKEDLNGKQVFKLVLTSAAGVKENLYLDVNTYYILRESTIMNANGQDVEIATTFTDYKKTPEGFVVPYASNLTFPGLEIGITSKKIVVNQPIEPSLFAMPKN